MVLWKECLWRQKANKTWNGQTGWLHLKTGIIDQFDQKAFQTTGPLRFESTNDQDGWDLKSAFFLTTWSKPRSTSCWAATWRTSGSRRRSSRRRAPRARASPASSTSSSLNRFLYWIADSGLQIMDKRFLKVVIVGLGGRWLRDFQEDDDSEEHWPSDGSPRTVAAKVQTLNTCPRNMSEAPQHTVCSMLKYVVGHA